LDEDSYDAILEDAIFGIQLEWIRIICSYGMMHNVARI
jgi:hypothetical protein